MVNIQRNPKSSIKTNSIFVWMTNDNDDGQGLNFSLKFIRKSEKNKFYIKNGDAW
jgi:hypothetical protein